MPADPTHRLSAPDRPVARRGSVRCAIRAFLRTEDGPTSVEYAVMLALILATIFGAVGAIGGTTGGLFQNAETELDAAGF